MSRVRIVNGSLDTFRRNVVATAPGDTSQVPPAMSREDAAKVAAAALSEKVGPCGTLSDPAGMMQDALGRFTEVSERQLPKAKLLCKERLVDDGRMTIPGCPDMDLVIVIDTTPDRVMDADGNMIDTERYLVFLRERGGNGEDLEIAPTCFTCNNAERRKMKPKAHACWRLRKPRANMVPTLYARAHGFDDAEDLAKEMRSAWQADREQEIGEEDWSLRMEIPFSPDWQAGYMAGRPNAWSTLGQDQQ